ncbi:PP2C family protein-serine/threonine phosphatase [Tropheryma whipplei]|uniref:PP2C family protein-serine/threonine phosphatase n=1 Tax=Tropheryma whipplei TaxID=2039 RepID=UPI0002EAAA37|nr:protein phosphatase 2C domain-containing protein [Tropheryma whipplei]
MSNRSTGSDDYIVSGKFSISWASLSHVGHHRESNEDSYSAKPPLWVVADGMGGHACGDIASGVVTSFLSAISSDFVSPQDITGALRQALASLAKKIGSTTAGTTLSGIGLSKVDNQPAWLVLNLGDSRVYCIESGKIRLLTEDHSIVHEMIKSGQITPEEAAIHPYNNIITRAVSFNSEPIPDFSFLPLRSGVRFIICSDGLTKELNDAQIETHATRGSPREAAESLLYAALSAGGRDNITIILLDVHDK